MASNVKCIAEDWNSFLRNIGIAATQESLEIAKKSMLFSLQHYEQESIRITAQFPAKNIKFTDEQILLLSNIIPDISEISMLPNLYASYFNDAQSPANSIRDCLNNNSYQVLNLKMIAAYIDGFTHLSNAFYYIAMEYLSQLPDKYLDNYKKLSLHWKNYPNGISLKLPKEEYERFAKYEFDSFEKLLTELQGNITIEDAELDKLNLQLEKLAQNQLEKQKVDKKFFFSWLNKKSKIGCVVTITFIFLAGVIFWPTSIVYSPSGDATNSPNIVGVPDEKFIPIDLGLTSGTLWANMNIGASAPYDFGEFYAWGETSTKNNYSQGQYKSKKNSGRALFQTVNDVANIKLGEEWTLPTTEQFQELISECTWEWILHDKHYGYQVTGRNGKSIFLPAGGWICSSNVEYQNKYGYYWTGEQVRNKPGFAKGLYISSGERKIGDGYLYYGRSIRAVRIKDTAIAE